MSDPALTRGRSLLHPRLSMNCLYITRVIASGLMFFLWDAGFTRSCIANDAKEPTEILDSEEDDCPDEYVVCPEDVEPGHSVHGETFNEGPRQAAKIMEGMTPIVFPTSAESKEAQAFFEQGVAQLHGFWYLEAERSFRQAAAIEPELAMAYWGCAMANANNRERAAGFIQKAKERLDSAISRRERMYVEALARFLLDDADQKDEKLKDAAKASRNQRLISDLEKIIDKFPDDIEAKAFLVLQLWLADREGVKLTSYYAVEALLKEIFAVQPMHPAHHYRIHLWDHRRPNNALESAAKSGPSLPGIAHMWHMPGHTYSKLFRYSDAVWQQEASARVDHQHMIRTHVLPDEIHNFSHNNEWMVRNLNHLGRVTEAVEQSKNLIRLPQHPEFNTYEKGSAKFGRERLLQSLSSFGLWSQLIEEAEGPYLSVVGDDAIDQERTSWLAVAFYLDGQPAEGAKHLRTLQRARLQTQTEILDSAEKLEPGKEKDSQMKELREKANRLRRLIYRVAAAASAVRGDHKAVQTHAEAAKLPPLLHGQWLARANDLGGAREVLEKSLRAHRGEVLPLAALCQVLWKMEKKEEAIQRFEELRKVAHSADIESPILAAMSPIAKEAGVKGDWRVPLPMADDLGERPPLDWLGPKFWNPPPSSPLIGKSVEGDPIDATQWDGKARVVIFYLGFGCLHCVEQLKALTPLQKDFEDAGIELIAISTEDQETLSKGIEAFDQELGIPIFTDPEQLSFREYRCWDDFESVAMHGTFLIDSLGRIRWQDIGPEPFTDVQFLLKESKRLLSMKYPK